MSSLSLELPLICYHIAYCGVPRCANYISYCGNNAAYFRAFGSMGSKDLGLVTIYFNCLYYAASRLRFAASRRQLPLLRRFAAPFLAPLEPTASTTPLRGPDCLYYAFSGTPVVSPIIGLRA